MLRYEVRAASGGAGKFRGGEGLRRDILLQADATASLLSDRRRGQLYGLAGVLPGERGEMC